MDVLTSLFLFMKTPDLTKKVLICLPFLLSVFIFAPNADAAVKDWQKGVSVYPHGPEDFASDAFKQTVQNIKDMGASHISLVIPIYQNDEQSSEIFPGGDTPSDSALKTGVDIIHAAGLKVVFKPHLESYSGTGWRAYIRPSNRDAWYANYSAMLNHLGDIGKEKNVDGIIMGTELISVSSEFVNPDNTERWYKMIESLRTHFSGFLTYDANWSWGNIQFEHEIQSIKFWPALDYIGVSAYYPLAQNAVQPSVDMYKDAWAYWDTSQLRALHEAYGKPLLFSEIGYKSVRGAHDAPCCTPPSLYDGEEQARLYEALFSYWNSSPYMSGVQLWYWDVQPGYGGDGNQDYTAQGKPAYKTIQTWFGGSGGGGGGNNETSSVSGDWTIGGKAQGELIAGTPVNLDVKVSISGYAKNVIVDMEIYDSNQRKVFQQTKEKQTIDPSGTRYPYDLEYTLNWTPPENGIYTLKVGVFSFDWGTNYIWNDNVLELPVGVRTGGYSTVTNGDDDMTASVPPVGSQINIWWPVQDSMLYGIQPFKASVLDTDIQNYRMYWQVDGDVLNEMYDSNVDSPHKEAYVDLTNWTWKDTGIYNINFVVKDLSGSTIAQKSVDIHVVH